MENDNSNAGSSEKTGCYECKRRGTCCVYGRFCIQRSGYDKRRDQSDRRRIRKDRDTGRVKQQCASLDTGRADGSAGDQFRAF